MQIPVGKKKWIPANVPCQIPAQIYVNCMFYELEFAFFFLLGISQIANDIVKDMMSDSLKLKLKMCNAIHQKSIKEDQ